MKRLLFTIFVLLSTISALPASAAASEPNEPVLARGAALHGANGVMFDRHDRLHIASVAGREIVVMDPQTGAILDRLGPAQGVEGPDDLTFGPDGALYWTSFFTGVVGRRAPDGTVGTVAQLPPGVGAITFSDDGRLFVAVSFPDAADALYEVDPNGANPPRLVAEQLGGLNAMDWGSDGFLYGPLNFRGQVVRINVDTGAVAPVADGFGLPTAAKFDSRGRLHVVDQLSGKVVRVNVATGRKAVVARLTPGLDSLAFDSRDRLFVSSFQDGFIAEVTADGEVRMVSGGGLILRGGAAARTRRRVGVRRRPVQPSGVRRADRSAAPRRARVHRLLAADQPGVHRRAGWRQAAAVIVVCQCGAALGSGNTRRGGDLHRLRRAAERDPLPG